MPFFGFHGLFQTHFGLKIRVSDLDFYGFLWMPIDFHPFPSKCKACDVFCLLSGAFSPLHGFMAPRRHISATEIE